MEQWNNIDVYSDEYMEEAVDIMEGFIAMCQDELGNHKKIINTKLSAVSSFYLWSYRRGLIDKHPFDKKLQRMQGAKEERILNNYYLTPEQIKQVRKEIGNDDEYDIQDQIIWEIAFDSANRIGALEKLELSKLNIDENMFEEIREKRGYRVEVVFEDLCKEFIQEWLEIRKDNYDKLEVDSLFITYYRGEYKPMSDKTIAGRIKRMAKILGIDDFHAHCTRKSALNNIYEETGDMNLAAELANHKSVQTTKDAYIKPKTKKETMDKIRELRKRKKEESSEE